MFAVRLLALASVLAALKIKHADDIEYLCGLTSEMAADRARRMEVLFQRNLFGKDSREKQVIESFHDFIANYHLTKY